MSRFEIFDRLKTEKIVAVIRGEHEKLVDRTVDAVHRGGIHLMEITFTVPRAEHVICDLVQRYAQDEKTVIGAGTCLDVVSARLAISAGAKFVVCPHLDIEILKLCNSYDIPCIPGAATVRDMHEALEYGAYVIKLFPGDIFGPDAIRAFHGPLPQAEFMPTGGVNASNITTWLGAGAIAVGTGGSLTKGASTGNYEAVTEEASKLVKCVCEFKNAI
ncbi:2-keto-3-deoxy-phosphogluconate aldolase [Coriobacterium glomerans PW2]|uniref:2-keto-3-deoxy-phosphogluconate aldolase n=1 Tax=Coriobacterium glomerans (strain ATCC 49209 / DSM 20642 / JCM 10262 / PW2) TaxID=700015 RepID=F2N7I9_CORGP|nr:bifunctional 2-keto-4-hydroxyglutarate aldolase/2-keto-3-deoxy-6-phosphogluconate aldolase [Coriobacterium glomerans]AEB06805.1 2-keto-3-deoxy-phosphogluconate aldolase [Coriobacterium glomerans PW2]